MNTESFGEFFKRKRLEKGLGLREFCVSYGHDPGNISKLERGVLLPPKDEKKLRQYAKQLGLAEGTEDCNKFFDLASLAGGRIPKSVLRDKESVGQLPLVFRTLRGERLSDRELNALVQKIRRS